MKTFKGAIAAFAGVAMIAMPIAASAAPANPAASLSVARANAPAAAGKSKLGASVGSATLINIGILAALVAIVLVATNGSDSSASK